MAFASFSTTTGSPTRAPTSSRNGSSRQARFGANSTVARLRSTKPAAPIPTASTSYERRRSATRAATASATAVGSVPGVGRRPEARITPPSSTTPAATLVPPTSTPIVRPTGQALADVDALERRPCGGCRGPSGRVGGGPDGGQQRGRGVDEMLEDLGAAPAQQRQELAGGAELALG